MSVAPCWFRRESGLVFLGVSAIFPYHKFLFTISPHSSYFIPSHSFHFNSSAPVMVRLACSAEILAIHRYLIASLDPTLCQTRVEEIIYDRTVNQLTSSNQLSSSSSFQIMGLVACYGLPPSLVWSAHSSSSGNVMYNLFKKSTTRHSVYTLKLILLMFD